MYVLFVVGTTLEATRAVIVTVSAVLRSPMMVLPFAVRFAVVKFPAARVVPSHVRAELPANAPLLLN